MTPAAGLVILDTNVLIHVVWQNPVGVRISRDFGLESRSDRPIISVVTVGEALGLARQFAWGPGKVDRLKSLMNNLVVVDVGRPGLPDRYAEITDFARRNGQAMSDNDRWIAATASTAGATLLTTDRDFDPLDPLFLQHSWIDPEADA